MSTAIQTFRLVINGEKIPTGRCFEVLNPANEKVAGLAVIARTRKNSGRCASRRQRHLKNQVKPN